MVWAFVAVIVRIAVTALWRVFVHKVMFTDVVSKGRTNIEEMK
jgi:hypothetical protein